MADKMRMKILFLLLCFILKTFYCGEGTETGTDVGTQTTYWQNNGETESVVESTLPENEESYTIIDPSKVAVFKFTGHGKKSYLRI